MTDTLQQYLECEAPEDALEAVVAKAFQIQGKATGRIEAADDLHNVAKMVAERLFAVWWPRTNYPEEELRDAIQAKYNRLKDRWTEIAARKPAWQIRREQEEREREARLENAETVKKVAEGCKVSERQARYLIRDGTTLPDRAAELAGILGGDAADYLRAKARPGRQINYVAWFMRPRYWDASFQEFAASNFEGDPDFAALTAARADFANLEELLTHADELGVGAEAARRVWREFKAWRVQRLYDLAMQQLGEEEERESDFG